MSQRPFANPVEMPHTHLAEVETRRSVSAVSIDRITGDLGVLFGSLLDSNLFGGHG